MVGLFRQAARRWVEPAGLVLEARSVISFTLIIFWLVNRGHDVIHGEQLNAVITTTRC